VGRDHSDVVFRKSSVLKASWDDQEMETEPDMGSVFRCTCEKFGQFLVSLRHRHNSHRQGMENQFTFSSIEV
jgi:hypothetical protein